MFFSRIREGSAWRRVRSQVAEHQPLLIGVTGSFHTTLAAEAIGLVLQDRHTVHISRTTRDRPPEITSANVVVADLNLQRPGDIDFMAQQLPWQIVVATNTASKNLELFGSKEMVAHEHTSLVSTLPKTAHAILNADDELIANMAYHTSAQITFYGTNNRAHVRLIRSTRNSRGGFVTEVAIAGHHYQLSLPRIISFSQIYPALAALAVVHVMGGNIAQAVKVLSEIHPSEGELSLRPATRGAKILDSSADATPETMLGALHALRTFPATRRIAILGDIADLGAETAVAHKKIGRAAAENVHIFIAVGELMRQAGAEALKRRPGPDVHHFNSASGVGEWLKPYLTPDDAILIAGSPDMHLEKVVEDLRNV